MINPSIHLEVLGQMTDVSDAIAPPIESPAVTRKIFNMLIIVKTLQNKICCSLNLNKI